MTNRVSHLCSELQKLGGVRLGYEHKRIELVVIKGTETGSGDVTALPCTLEPTRVHSSPGVIRTAQIANTNLQCGRINQRNAQVTI
jgi:hypothetical protein